MLKPPPRRSCSSLVDRKPPPLRSSGLALSSLQNRIGGVRHSYGVTPAGVDSGNTCGVVGLLADSGQLFTGNATTEAVLRLVDGRRRIGEIGAELCAEFEVGLEEAVADTLDVAADLVEEHILVVVG